jgi:tripartite ATP-independent transporter DctM subunit
MMSGALMAGIAVIAHRRRFPTEEGVRSARGPDPGPRLAPAHAAGGAARRDLPGVFTPTEAAAVAAAYALALAGLVYRAIGPRELVDLIAGSLRSMAVVSVIIAGAFVLNYAIATEQIPMALAGSLSRLALPPLAFLAAINLIFLVLGCFLDTTTMLLVLVPLLLPAVKALGINLVHFGVVIIVNMMIGLVTPPYGVLLFVLNALTGIPLREMIREVWPFIGLLIVALALMVVFPETVLWLPRQLGYKT